MTEGVGPEALRDNLIGAKPGNRPVSAPLYQRIANAVPNAADFRTRMRGAYWNSVSGGTPAAVTRNVDGLTPTRMGSHLFDPAEHDLMRNVARVGTETPAQLKEAARLAKTNEPKIAKPEVGKSGEIADRMLGYGREGEKVFGALDRALHKNGDIKNAARTWGRMSAENRDEFRGAWLRNMGGGGEQFSLAKFATNWEKYSDQAKSIMLGREHRADVHDFYLAAKKYGDTLQKYGNPSGTAQVSTWHKLVAGAFKTAGGVATGTLALYHPIFLAAGGLGLHKLSRILATPQGARNVSKFMRVGEAYRNSPSPAKLALFSSLSRSLENEQPAH